MRAIIKLIGIVLTERESGGEGMRGWDREKGGRERGGGGKSANEKRSSFVTK